MQLKQTLNKLARNAFQFSTLIYQIDIESLFTIFANILLKAGATQEEYLIVKYIYSFLDTLKLLVLFFSNTHPRDLHQ